MIDDDDDDYQPSPEALESMLAANAEWERARRWKDQALPEGWDERDDPKTFLRNLILGKGTS